MIIKNNELKKIAFDGRQSSGYLINNLCHHYEGFSLYFQDTIYLKLKNMCKTHIFTMLIYQRQKPVFMQVLSNEDIKWLRLLNKPLGGLLAMGGEVMH